MVRLSRVTWTELQALRPADALGDDRVFRMTAWRCSADTTLMRNILTKHRLMGMRIAYDGRRACAHASVREGRRLVVQIAQSSCAAVRYGMTAPFRMKTIGV